MIYKTIEDIPCSGRELIKDLVNRGILDSYNGEIDLEDTLYKVLVILARIGII